MNLLSGIQQDFHRPQRSPGAYEWWHFDGTDERTGFSFSLQFFAGNLLSPYYQDSLRTYWEKTKSPLLDPSAQVPPPQPLDFCGVAFRIFHKGRMVSEALQEFPSNFLKASDQHGAVLLGPSRFNWDEKGDPPSYVITAQAPTRGGRGLLRARLFFTPQASGILGLPQPELHSTHTWVLAAPLCHVEGTLQWCDHEGEVNEEQGFVGKGYHDHHFGSVPIDRFVRSWHWGRAFLGNETLVYSVQTPADEKEAVSGVLLTIDPSQVQTWNVGFELANSRRNFFWLPYQKTFGFTDAQSLKVDHRRIMSDGPVSLIFEDRVEWIKNGKNFKGSGMSSYLYTPRLSSRFFFPMLKGKTSVFLEKDSGDPTPPEPGDVSTTRPAV